MQVSSAPFLSVFNIIPNAALVGLLFVMFFFKKTFNNFPTVFFWGSVFGIFSGLFSEYSFFVVYLTWISVLSIAFFLIKNSLTGSAASFLFLVALESAAFLSVFFGLSFFYSIATGIKSAFLSFGDSVYFIAGQTAYNLAAAVFLIVFLKRSGKSGVKLPV